MDQQLKILDGLTDAVLLLDGNGNCLSSNIVATRLFEYSPDVICGQNISDLLQTGSDLDQLVAQVLDQESNLFVDAVALTRSGGSVPVQVKLSTVDWSQKRVVMAAVNDLSHCKELEGQLHIFKKAFDSSIDGMVITDHRRPDNPIIHANKAFQEITGYERDEILGQNCRFLQNDDRDQDQLDEIRKAIAEGRKCNVKLRNYRKDGTLFWNELSLSPILNAEGQLTHFIGIQHDITERVRTQKALEESEQKFRALAEEALVGVYLIQDDKFKYINPQMAQIMGFDRNELIDGPSPLSLVHPDDREKVAANIKRRLQSEIQSLRYEFRGMTREGDVRLVEAYGSRTNYNEQPAVIGMLLDVTEQRNYENKLKRNAELFGQLFKNAPVGLIMLDSDQNVVRANHHFTELFGYDEEEIKNQPFDDLITKPDDREEAYELTRDTLKGQTFQHETVRYHKDGTPVDVLIAGSPVIVNGEIIAIYGMYVDITKRVKAEKKMEQSLREKEVLLEEIHHRVKNNLAIITGLLELQSYTTENEELRATLRDSQNRLQTMRIIHEQLYQFESLSDIQLNHYIYSLVDTIKQTLATDITGVDVNIDADPVSLEITRAVPCGLLLNELITNAYKHAFEEQQSGRIDIRVKEEDGALKLVISDNGKGLPNDFELESNSSLGASLINTLTQQLNAELDIQNANGATFTITFPL